MEYAYDDQNIFAKILRGEIPNKTVYENDYALAFEDITPCRKCRITTCIFWAAARWGGCWRSNQNSRILMPSRGSLIGHRKSMPILRM